MSQSKILSWFLGDILGQEFLNLHDPYIHYYCTIVLYDTRWYDSSISVVLYIGIMNVQWGFLSKNSTNKPAKNLLCDSMAALVRHSQA